MSENFGHDAPHAPETPPAGHMPLLGEDAARPGGGRTSAGASEADAGEALRRLTQFVTALDRATVRLQEAATAEEIPVLAGGVLHDLGIESHLALLETPVEATGARWETTLDSATLHLRYLSAAPGLLRALERALGRSPIGLPMPLAEVGVFLDVMRRRQPAYLDRGDVAQVIRGIVPWVSEQSVDRLIQLVHASTGIVAPLLSRGFLLGVMGVWSDDLRPEDTVVLGTFARQVGFAIERIHAMDDARRRADELEAVFTSIADGVAIYDREGKLARINAAGLGIIRYQPPPEERPEQRRDQSVMRRLNGTPLPVTEMPVSRTLRGETFHDAEYVIDGVDGPDTKISASGAPLLAPTGESQGGVVVFRNVTQIRRLAYRTHEALDALLRIAAMLVAPITPDQDGSVGHIVPAPDAEEAPVGEGAMGRSLSALLHSLCQLGIGVLGCDRLAISLVDPDTHAMTPGVMAGLTPAQQAHWNASLEHPTSPRQALRIEEWLPPAVRERFLAGEAILLDLTPEPFTDRERAYGASLVLEVPLMVGNRLVGMMGLDHLSVPAGEPPHIYTTDEIALAQGLARLAALAVERERLLRVAAEVEALRAANALKEEFLSMASHELRTPLTVLQARTQATRRRLLRAGHTEAAEQFAPVQHSLNRILGLVQELLEASRIQAGPLALHLEPCDLGSLLAEVAGEAREASERTITLDGAESPGLWTLADRERLRQVVTNLLENAVKYSPPEQPVALRIWRQPVSTSPSSTEAAGGREEVVMWFHDEGVGIPPDEVTLVFQRFYRARTSSVRQYGGLGLGLHIAATIIERHGGRIWAESPGPGEGTTFCVALPTLGPLPAE